MAIRTIVWGENVHDQTSKTVQSIYPDGMHSAIASGLNDSEFIAADTAVLQDAEHGLTRTRLNETDVLIWWGHAAHNDVSDVIVERVQQRVWEGMGLIVLHSGHFSKIFRRLMGAPCSLTWREAGERERLWVINPAHPIVQGLGPYIELPNAEMYGEPFAVPEPMETVLVSWFEGGEVFRSGLTYQRGAGRIFYFRPGHETYPIYHNDEVKRLLKNAVQWAYNPAPAWHAVNEAPNRPVQQSLEPLQAKGPRLHRDGEGGLRLIVRVRIIMQRLLILGTGNMARTHAAAFAQIPGCEIVAAVDCNAENLDRFCSEFGVETRFSRLSDAIAWGDFDAASNVTPDGEHHPTTMQLIAAGKHVFCEKPLAETYPLARQMADAVADAGLVGMVNLTYRESSALQHMHGLVRSGEIGAIRHFEAGYLQSWLVGQYWGDWRTEKRWLWRLSEEHGGTGVLGDVGIHVLDFASYGANSHVAAVSCKLKTFSKAPGDRIGDYPLTANDSAVLTVELENGAMGAVHASRYAAGYANTLKLVIHGDAGAIRVNLDQSWDHLDICRGANVNNQAWERIRAPQVDSNYVRFIRSLDQAPDDVIGRVPDFETGARLQQVLDKCVKSDAEGRRLVV